MRILFQVVAVVAAFTALPTWVEVWENFWWFGLGMMFGMCTGVILVILTETAHDVIRILKGEKS